MAEAQEELEEQPEGGGSNKMIIIFAAVLLVAVGGSVGGTMFLLGGDAEAAVEEEVEPEPTKPVYHELRPAFVVQYIVGSKQRYLQTELAVMSRNPQAIEAVVTHSPLVRARVIDHLTDLSFEDLQGEDGKRELQSGLAGIINEVISEHDGEGAVESVLFSSFVMQ